MGRSPKASVAASHVQGEGGRGGRMEGRGEMMDAGTHPMYKYFK